MSGSGSTGRTSGIVISCSGGCSVLTSSMFIIYMRTPNRRTSRSEFHRPADLLPVSENRDIARFRLRPQFREVDPQEAVLELPPGTLVIDTNVDCDLTAELPMEPLDAQVRRHTGGRRLLTLLAGDNQHAVIP